MTQNRFIAPLTLLLVLLLPLAQLAWASAHKAAAPHTYTVPIGADDPRDLLRGRYITYRYLWDRAAEKPDIAPLPDRGSFYVDERDADMLQIVLATKDFDGAAITYIVLDQSITPSELTLSGKPYKQVLDCMRAQPDPVEDHIQDCLAQ